MLCLIGLGLNENSLSLEALGAIKKCSVVYLENYTVNLPYGIAELERNINKKIVKLERKDVEGSGMSKILEEAKKNDVALLIYGSPLFATTHLALLEEAKKQRVKCKVMFNASVFDAVASCGLQLYKFGKIASIPAWTEKHRPDSFIDDIKENLKIKAHSLLLCDIGLEFNNAIQQLEVSAKNKNLKIEKIVVCSCLGTAKQKIYYKTIGDLEEKKLKVEMPYCIIIPSDLHFTEKEFLESL